MLQGKYIKYTKDITLEIFTKIIERLNKAGWKHMTGRSINSQFNKFTYDNYLVHCTKGNDYSFYKDSVLKATDIELKVSDILGDDWNKPQFEVGKWYKFSGYGEYISRFKTVKNNNFITDTGYIFNGGYETDTSNDAIININREFTEVPIEEVRQYLPDGHPDKLSKPLTVDDLVEGEFYFAECSKEEWNSLFYCKTPPRFTARLYISDKYSGKRYDPGDWGFTKGNKYRLATPEEKQWLNVCISEGKFVEKDYALRDYDVYGKVLKSEIIEKEIKHQFKVGDWVYADRKSDGDFRYELGDSYIPIFKVEEIYKSINTGEWLRPIKNKANGIESKYCRLATPEEIAKVTKPVEKSFEFNKWYKPDNADGLFFIKSKNTGYGFRSNHANYWFTNNKDFEWNIDGLEPATDSEVKERLLKYAKEKYPVGTIVKSAQNLSSCWNINTNWVYTGLNRLANFGFAVFYEGKWAEIISTPVTKESKEMQLSDLKNPVFNIGDKVRVIANSLKEFNSSWLIGNNAKYKKGYEGLITKFEKTKSVFTEINTWYCLDNNSNEISCNLLELVEPVKKEFDRNWYVEVNSQEEADKVFGWLEAQGENTFRGHACFNKTFKYIRQWNNASSEYHNKWFLSSEKNNKPQKQLSDILPEYKQSIKTEEELSHIINTNEDLRNEIQGLINQRDFKSSDFVEPIIIKSKNQKRNKLIIVNN